MLYTLIYLAAVRPSLERKREVRGIVQEPKIWIPDRLCEPRLVCLGVLENGDEASRFYISRGKSRVGDEITRQSLYRRR